jgi:hypothetical protein
VAKYGIVGQIVDSITPHSEADPVGLLVHLLIFFGNAVGSGPHFTVASDRHSLNEFAVTVGETAKARKASAFNHSRQIYTIASPHWAERSIETGLSSGEGLIQSVLERSNVNATIVDPLLIFESEFGSALRVMLRQGNTLSPVLRQAWDASPLGVLTRKNSLKAKASHVSLIGHITQTELTDLLSRSDIFGGFANRILWVCVRRHGMHPELGGIPDSVLRRLAKMIKAAIKASRTVREISFSVKATKKWKELYPSLSSAQPGVLGAVISRAEPHVLRLAGIYALMNQSRVVRTHHLSAAVAVWKYCSESAEVIFGKKQSSSLEDRISQLLIDSANGLTRTQISAAFDNHKSSGAISEALHKLQGEGRATWKVRQTGGRSAQVWRPAISKEGN